MSQKKPIYVVVSIDVEEEGLFTGRYDTRISNVRNLEWMKELDPLLEKGVRPTLFCAYSVFKDPQARPVLESLRDGHGAEIGAHLHYWNTPPLAEGPEVLTSVPTIDLDDNLFASKLETLFKAGREFQGQDLKSFRMGRWDLHTRHWPLLFDAGIKVDSSIRPLFEGHSPRKGPDHFGASNQPYFVEYQGRNILEVPLTVAPISGLLARAHNKIPAGLGKKARFFMRYWNTISLLPVYYPLGMLKLATRLALSGGDVLVTTWHSSEMMPGGAPHLADQAAIKAMLAKAGQWIDWLRKNWDVKFVTLSELAAIKNHAPVMPAGSGDWRP